MNADLGWSRHCRRCQLRDGGVAGVREEELGELGLRPRPKISYPTECYVKVDLSIYNSAIHCCVSKMSKMDADRLQNARQQATGTPGETLASILSHSPPSLI